MRGFTVVYYCFSGIKKLLGRTETRTRDTDRMYCQTLETFPERFEQEL